MSFGSRLPPVGGKPLLTKERPIRLLNEAVRELQDGAVDSAKFAVSGLAVTGCGVEGNTLKVQGVIGAGGYSLAEIFNRLVALEERVDGLGVRIDLDLDGGALKATGTLVDDGESTEGRTVEVTDCDESEGVE